MVITASKLGNYKIEMVVFDYEIVNLVDNFISWSAWMAQFTVIIIS